MSTDIALYWLVLIDIGWYLYQKLEYEQYRDPGALRPSGGTHAVARPPDGRGDQRPVRARQEEHPAGAHRLHVGPYRDSARARHRVRPGARRGGESGGPLMLRSAPDGGKKKSSQDAS